MSEKETINCQSCGEPQSTAPEGVATPTHCEWCGVEYPVPGEDETGVPSGSRKPG